MNRTEDNNDGKVGSREYIASVINYYFKDKKELWMFDFLGAGIGAEYYLKKCNCIKYITLLDYKSCKYKKFLLESYRDLQWNNLDKLIEVFNLDINEYLDDVCPTCYDIFNLDFCTYFYDNGKDNCSASIINKSFETNVIANNGLLFCTFQTKGLGVNFGKSKHEVITDKDIIIKKIIAIGKQNNYDVKYNDISYTYKSSKSSEMINICFEVKKEAK